MMKNIYLSIIVLLLISCNNNSSTIKKEIHPSKQKMNSVLTTAETIAVKNGLDKWDTVNQINFTFNVDRKENHYERSWSWRPKDRKVTMITATDTVTYNRNQIDSTYIKIDQAFINDKYWLLAPYQLVWDKGTRISEQTNKIAPLSKDTLNVITIAYGAKGGYTPGDAYDFYFDKDFIIREWVFRKNNDSLPSMITTWEDYENFNGISIAKTHRDSANSFRLYFSNIHIK